MGIPSLKEQFDVKELDIPDYFEVEADVKDYELSEGMTIATNDIFNDLETENSIVISELKNSMKTLQDSANKLVERFGRIKKRIRYSSLLLRNFNRRYPPVGKWRKHIEKRNFISRFRK